MSIHPQKQDISELFSVNQPYYIDFYQRDYKWGKEHVEKLLEDLFYRFRLEYDENKDVNQETISRYDWYYLNAYVTNEYQGKTFIVDGQQRLATLTLILIKLLHLAKEYGLEKRAELISKHIYGIGIEDDVFWMGQGDRSEVLEDLYANGERTKEIRAKDLSLVNLYKNYDVIDRNLSRNLDTLHKFQSFLLYFLMRVMLVKIQINASRDVPMVFEVINDRGERLKPYEVLKGKLLGQLDKDEVDEYCSIWERQTHNLQSLLDDEVDYFFRYYFRSRFVDTETEYREFDGDYHKTIYEKKWNHVIGLKNNPSKVKDFVKGDFHYYSQLYYNCNSPLYSNDVPDIRELLYNDLNDQDRQFLLILSSCTANDSQETEKIQTVSRLFDRHFAVLQLTDSYDSYHFTDSIMALNKGIRGKSVEEIEQTFWERLLKDISAAKDVDVNEPFPYNYFENASSLNLGVRFIRYFFARIEHFIAESCGYNVDKYYNLVRNTGRVNGYHVEHILANNDENIDLFDSDEETFIEQRNRLGALTLLKGRENLSSGNEPFSKKLETYSGKANLVWTQTLTESFYHSNPNFKDFINQHDLDFKPYSKIFDAEAVEERHRLLYDLARVIWMGSHE